MICYHHNDLDGRCAGAIVNKKFGNIESVDFIEMDYAKPIDLSQIERNEYVIIVDFSFTPDVMDSILRRTDNVVWIDHHVTAKEYPYQSLKGLRDFSTKGLSGCELTWNYLFPEHIIPDAVHFIGDYDAWRLDTAPRCFQFYEGMKLEDTDPKSKIWNFLFLPSTGGVDMVVEHGKNVIKYRDNYCSNIRTTFGYEVFWEGHRAYATNIYRFGSQGFNGKMEEYDFCIAYIHDGKKFTVSLYSEKIDVSVICKKYGGGGHQGAASFRSKNLPWIDERYL